MVASSHELHSLRSISPTSLQQLVTGDEEFRTSGYDDENGSPRHRRSNSNPLDASAEPAHVKESTHLSSSSRLIDRSWILEILSWVLAALTLMILVIVLDVFKGKLLSDWHSSVSVNTLINVLTTIASIALVFPVASGIAQLRWLSLSKRDSPIADIETFGSGPIDIFVMIWRHPTMLLAYFGALNIILIILFSPITQETIDLPIIQHKLPLGTGSIATTSAYRVDNSPDQRTYTTEEDTFKGMKKYDSVAKPMNVAINAAVQQILADPSEVQATCQTGNCTFALYETMGICAQVDDVTATIVRNCHHESSGPSRTCFYSVADLQDQPPWREDNMTVANPQMSLWVGASDVHPPNYPNPNALGTFYTIYLPDTKAFDTIDQLDDFTPALVALKGSLNLCTITYNTSVTNGVTKTVETQRTTNLPWSPAQADIQNTDTPVISAKTASGGTEYQITQSSGFAFKTYLSAEIFHGDSQVGTGGELGSTAASATLAQFLVNRPKQEGNDELVKMLDNMAVAMTNALRTTSSSPSTANGVATNFQIHISVHFGWLVLPIASVILALVFLLAVIAQSARRGVPAWKTSQVKMLLSLDWSAAEKLVRRDDVGKEERLGSERRAREIRWRLGRREEGDWRLIC